MPYYCAIPPIDQSVSRAGRGYGMGWNRLCGTATAARRVEMGCHPDQLHGGMDFAVAGGTPIVAPIPGRVILVSEESGPGYNRAMTGYGNSVVLQHDFALARPNEPLPGQRSIPPALPSPFWTTYNHMRDVPNVRVGQRVVPGDLLGYVGNTNNGSFPGMASHFHFEVRRRPPPSSYDNDTIDPLILWKSLGIDLIGSHQDGGRRTGGNLQIVQSGPSDCAGHASELSGFGDVVKTYVDPASKTLIYSSKGTTIPLVDVPQPPDYADVVYQGSAISPIVVVAAGTATALVLAALYKRRQKEKQIAGMRRLGGRR